MHAKSLQSCPTLRDPLTVAHQVPLSMGFFRQEYWSGLPFPSPGDLPNPGIKPESTVSPALQMDSFLLIHWGSRHKDCGGPLIHPVRQSHTTLSLKGQIKNLIF